MLDLNTANQLLYSLYALYKTQLSTVQEQTIRVEHDNIFHNISALQLDLDHRLKQIRGEVDTSSTFIFDIFSIQNMNDNIEGLIEYGRDDPDLNMDAYLLKKQQEIQSLLKKTGKNIGKGFLKEFNENSRVIDVDPKDWTIDKLEGALDILNQYFDPSKGALDPTPVLGEPFKIK